MKQDDQPCQGCPRVAYYLGIHRRYRCGICNRCRLVRGGDVVVSTSPASQAPRAPSTSYAEVRRIDDSLRDATWKTELLFSNGFPWAGYAIFTGEMGDHLNTLQRLAREAGDAVARTRAFDAPGADERLRSDVERLAEGLRQVIPLYIWGIVSSYRGNYPTPEKVSRKAAKEGLVHIPPSATGREPTRTLRLDDRGRVRDLRLHLRVLFRSVIMRLDLVDLKDAPFGFWPIDMAEAYQEEADLRVDLTIPYGT
jgi:hypothetical protein